MTRACLLLLGLVGLRAPVVLAQRERFGVAILPAARIPQWHPMGAALDSALRATVEGTGDFQYHDPDLREGDAVNFGGRRVAIRLPIRYLGVPSVHQFAADSVIIQFAVYAPDRALPVFLTTLRMGMTPSSELTPLALNWWKDLAASQKKALDLLRRRP